MPTTNDDSLPDRVNLSQIAELAGVSAPAVSNWRKRGVGFPQPVESVGREDRFLTSQVVEWLRETGRLSGDGRLPQDEELGEDAATLGFEMALCVIVALSDPPEVDRLLSLPDRELPESVRRAAQALEVSEKVPAGALTAVLPDVLLSALVKLVESRSEPARTTGRHLLATQLRRRPRDAARLFEELDARRRAVGGRHLRPHRTPLVLASFLADLLPEETNTVFDPAAGEAQLLLECAQRRPVVKCTGIEIDRFAWAVAVQRLLVHRISGSVRNADALAGEPRPGKRPVFAGVVCEPPLGTKAAPSDDLALRFRRAASASADMQWVLRCLDALRLGGTAVVTQPAGVLFREGADAHLRRQLATEGWLKAVIALPAIDASTSLPLVVLVLEHKPADVPPTDVFFADLTNTSGQTTDQAQKVLPVVAEHIRQWRTNPASFQPLAGITALVPILDLVSSDAPMTPGYWVSTQTRLATRSDWVKNHDTAVDRVANAATWVGTIDPPDPYLPWTMGEPPVLHSVQTLADVGRLELIRGQSVDKSEFTAEGHPVLTVASFTDDDGELTAERFVAAPLPSVTRAGDVVVLARGRRIRGAVDSIGGHSVAAPLLILRLGQDDAMPPQLLAALVSSERVQTLASGSTMKGVSPKSLTIPRIDPRTTHAAGDYLAYLDLLDQAAHTVIDQIEVARASLISGLEAGAVVEEQP